MGRTAKPRVESYLGAKGQSGTWQRICSLMPAHRVYLEACFGTGLVMGRKRPAEYEVGIDVDPDAVAAWPTRPHHRPGPVVGVRDVMRILSSWKAMMDPTWFVYVDPPYPLKVRGEKRYRHEPELENPQWHKQLLALLIDLPCRVMVSCYWNPLYVTTLQDWQAWRAESFRSMTRGGVAQEWLWMNYAADVPLHDTRYVGRGFRERERIKRKRQRWVQHFMKMPPAERQVIAEALAIATAEKPSGTTSPAATMAAALAVGGEGRSTRRVETLFG